MVTVEFCALRLHTCVCRWGEGGDTFPSTSFAPNTLAVRCFDSGWAASQYCQKGPVQRFRRKTQTKAKH